MRVYFWAKFLMASPGRSVDDSGRRRRQTREAAMRARSPNSLLYLGIKGTVLALDRASGMEQWRTPLAGSDFVNVVLDGDSVYATTKGEIFCLDPLSGQIRWNNPLKGMGWGLITIAGSSIVPMAQKRANDTAAAASMTATQMSASSSGS